MTGCKAMLQCMALQGLSQGNPFKNACKLRCILEGLRSEVYTVDENSTP